MVFDDVPAALTADKSRELYGIEAADVMDTSTTANEVFQNAMAGASVALQTSH